MTHATKTAALALPETPDRFEADAEWAVYYDRLKECYKETLTALESRPVVEGELYVILATALRRAIDATDESAKYCAAKETAK